MSKLVRTPIEAVLCEDFFADKIAEEQENAPKYGQDYTDMFFTKTFVNSGYICPNTSSIELNNVYEYL